MIREWCLANFKSVRDPLRLDFKPLTLFAGANSSGKSTILQSILLVAQTVSSKLASRSVVLNGSLVRLGTFDIRSFAGGRDEAIWMRWKIVSENVSPDSFLSSRALSYRRHGPYLRRGSHRLTEVECELQLEISAADAGNALFQLQPRLRSCRLSATIPQAEGPALSPCITITRASEDPATRRTKLGIDSANHSSIESSLAYETSLDAQSRQYVQRQWITAEPVGCRLAHFLPELVALRIDAEREHADVLAEALCGEARPSLQMIRLARRPVEIPSNVLSSIRRRLGAGMATRLDIVPRRVPPGKKAIIPPITLTEWQRRLGDLPEEQRLQVQMMLRRSKASLVKALSESGDGRFEMIHQRIPELYDTVSYLDSFFTNSVRYLGPLRDEPTAPCVKVDRCGKLGA